MTERCGDGHAAAGYSLTLWHRPVTVVLDMPFIPLATEIPVVGARSRQTLPVARTSRAANARGVPLGAVTIVTTDTTVPTWAMDQGRSAMRRDYLYTLLAAAIGCGAVGCRMIDTPSAVVAPAVATTESAPKLWLESATLVCLPSPAPPVALPPVDVELASFAPAVTPGTVESPTPAQPYMCSRFAIHTPTVAATSHAQSSSSPTLQPSRAPDFMAAAIGTRPGRRRCPAWPGDRAFAAPWGSTCP